MSVSCQSPMLQRSLDSSGWRLLVTISSLDGPLPHQADRVHGHNAMDQRPGYILIGMLPMWLVRTLPTWLVIFIVLYALAALYVAIKFREVRKFLAGAFFVSSGILWYLWLTGT